MSSKEKMMKSETRSETVPPVAATPVTAALGPQASPQEPVVPFDKWFKVRGKEKGFKPHWAAGMQAYADTSVPRPMSEWDRIFKSY